MTRQLTFDLPSAPRLTRADFFVSPANALALAAIDAWHDWPNRKMVLTGPKGAGKSHLAQIWAAAAGAALVTAQNLGDINLPELSAAGAVVVEDAETLAGHTNGEAALFHLHNMLAASGTLLVTALSPPRDWGLVLPDLASRLQAAPLTQLCAPDDALLSAVLAKLFSDRQLAIPSNLIPYMVVRMDRSIAAARSLVEAIDSHALARHRPVTRSLVGEILESHDAE